MKFSEYGPRVFLAPLSLRHQFKPMYKSLYTLSLMLSAGICLAQDTERRPFENPSTQKLEEVTVTGNTNRYGTEEPSRSLKLRTPLLQIPQNVQVVNELVLKDQQVISMSDGITRNVSGLVRMEHWGDLYTNISARGAQVQAFRNGFNVVNSYWGPLTEDMSFVDRIEFVKGPAGFMLSSGDPAGLYNVVTKKPTGIPSREISMTMGSFQLYRTTLDIDGKLSKNGKLLYRLNLAAQNKGSHRPNEFNDRYVIAPVISYQWNEKTRMSLEYNYQRAHMSDVGSYYVFAPAGFATLPVDFTSLPGGLPATNIDDHSFYLNIEHQLGQGWTLTGQASRFIYNQTGSSMWPSAVNPDGTMIRSVGVWDAFSTMTMGQAFIQGDVQTGSIGHRILGGLDMANKHYIADWGQSHDLDLPGSPFDPKNPDLGIPANGYPSFDRETPLAQRAQMAFGLIDQSYSSLYLQDELQFFDRRVRLTLAGRYTDLSQSIYGAPADEAQRFTPRVGMSISLDRNTSVYGLFDQAFIPQTGRLRNGDLARPVTGDNYEIGLKKDWLGGRWSTTLAAYRTLKNNEIVADPLSNPSLGLSIELGQKLATGIEFDIKGQIFPGFQLVANYAFTESRVLKLAPDVVGLREGDLVPGFARHTANLWGTYRVQQGLLRGWGLSGGFTYLGGRATYWNPAPNGQKELEDYTRVDAGLFWEGQQVRVQFQVSNLLDQYLYSGSYYTSFQAYSWQSEPPRNYRMTIAYRF